MPARIQITLIGASLIALLAPCSAQSALPDYQFQLQARTNLLVNDNGFNLPPGASFNSISADINAAKQVSFRVQIVPGTDANGVWFGSGGVGSLRCFSENNIDAVISEPSLDAGGIVVFKQAFGSLNGVYRCDPANPPATRLTTGPLGTSDWGAPEINDAGQIGYRAGFNGPQAWVSRGTDGNFAVHLADLNADVSSPYNFLFSPVFSSSRKQFGVARRAAAGGNPEFTELVSASASGQVQIVLRSRAGDASSTIQSFDSTAPAVNAAEQVAIIVTLVGGTRAVVRVNGDGSGLTEIARVGNQDITTLDFFGAAIDDAGRVVFRGRDSQGRALFVGDGSALKRIIGLGSTISTDLGLAQIGQNNSTDEIFSGRPNVNAAGDVAFVAALHPNGNNQVEWGSGVFVASVVVDTDVLLRNGFE